MHAREDVELCSLDGCFPRMEIGGVSLVKVRVRKQLIIVDVMIG